MVIYGASPLIPCPDFAIVPGGDQLLVLQNAKMLFQLNAQVLIFMRIREEDLNWLALSPFGDHM
ncbi:MAG TPA: hypothetical protein VLB04_07570 [Methanotrichaceae archaeon]|nr:hypothetical protein [Methanotrichaceae archaeon]